MSKVTKVLLLLKNMIYESTSPLETIRFSKYYKKKGLDVTVVLWGPMGILLGKKNKIGRITEFRGQVNKYRNWIKVQEKI